MAAAEATIVDAGGRDLRVSSPDRVIFPMTERSGAVTKLDIVEYYLAVEDGIMRALERRPTTLERWPKGVHPGIVVSTREKGGGDAFFQKRVPRGAPDYLQTARIEFPSGRHADEICPTEIAVVGWAAQMGTITFHPWPVRSDDVDHPDELRIDLDPQPGTDFADAVRVAAEARLLLEELGYTGFPKTSGGRGVHIYVRIEPRWTFTEVRRAAIAFGRELERRLPGEVTTRWWKEERGERIFVDYNQNARDRTIASAYSVRPKAGAPVSAPVTWDELPDVAPEDFTVATMPARFAEVGDRHAAIDDAAHSLQPLLDRYEKDVAEGYEDLPYPPDYPKMPGEPKCSEPGARPFGTYTETARTPPHVADTARASGCGKPGAPGSPGVTSSSPTRERIATPFHWGSREARPRSHGRRARRRADRRTPRPSPWSPAGRPRPASARPTRAAAAACAASPS